jgi:hypothetical protein
MSAVLRQLTSLAATNFQAASAAFLTGNPTAAICAERKVVSDEISPTDWGHHFLPTEDAFPQGDKTLV